MVLCPPKALATSLPAAVTLAIVLLKAIPIVNDIVIAMTVARALDTALADTRMGIIVHPYQEEEKNYVYFCSMFVYGYCFVHRSGYEYGY